MSNTGIDRFPGRGTRLLSLFQKYQNRPHVYPNNRTTLYKIAGFVSNFEVGLVAKGLVVRFLPAYASIDEIVSTITVIGTVIISLCNAMKCHKGRVTHNGHYLPDWSIVPVDFSSVHTEYPRDK
jgi:hypothetical protein